MKSTIPSAAAALLNFIAKYESGGNYLAYFGHASSLKALPATLGAVIGWQHQLVADGAKSSAAGRYQFMPKTLQALMKQYAIPASEPFTSDLQDELGFYLLIGRGYDEWEAGKLTDAKFADALSMEWASMPYNTNHSYYDKDGLNKSLVSRTEFMAAIVAAKNAPAGATKEPPMAATPTATTTAPAKVNFVQGLINFAENAVAQIESSIKVAVSPNNSVTVTPGTSAVSGVFSSISNAQLAISELGKCIADAKAGAWSNEPSDVIALLKTIFTILSSFGIMVPGLTQIVTMLPSLEPVVG